MSAPSKTKASLISCLNYRDADAAISWLVQAFGSEAHAVYRDDAGRAVHAELTFGNGMIMLGPYGKGEFGKRFMTLPELADSRCTQSIYVIVDVEFPRVGLIRVDAADEILIDVRDRMH